MREVTMPASPNFLSSTFTLSRAGSVSGSPFTGKQRTQEFDYAGWSADVALPPMNRATVAAWQSWMALCKGSSNYFQFCDPDAKTNRGTYDGDDLIENDRIVDTTATLTFSGANIVATENIFTTSVTRGGDYIHVTGATNEENNGTHKISSRSSDTTIVTTSSFTAESGTANCKVQQNVKGATALSLLAESNSATGTILAGDYLAVLDSASTSGTPQQLLLVTENATVTSAGGSAQDFVSVAVEPKLRSNVTNAAYVKFASPRGRFRLGGNVVEWSANKNSIYSLSFSCSEVI